MRRLLAFFGGILSGGVAGTLVAILFTPASGGMMRDGLRQRWANALAAGDAAAQHRRAELEAKLHSMTTPPAGDDATGPAAQS